MPTYTGRQVGGLFVVLIGLGVMATGLAVNPWVARLWQAAYAVDKLDVLGSYCLWAFGLGAGIVWGGTAFSKAAPGSRVDRALVIGLPVALLILGDRLLLVEFGLPLWTHDSELHYRHRPNAVRTLAPAGRPHDFIEINAWGHHDGNFPEAKPKGEFRALMIGDSITMGDQLTYAQTFHAHLEGLLAQGDHGFESYQVINTGVHGYTTYQEMKILDESMRFDPDFIAIGFCMNDVTDPSVVNRGFEDAAADYHRVAPTSNPIYGYILNDTGVGRLAQAIAARSTSLAAERQTELADVLHMASSTTSDPKIARAFGHIFDDLSAMYATARAHDVPAVLLLFPYTFQLLDAEARAPQQLLREHALAHGVQVIDFTPIFADRIYDDPELLALLRRRGYPTERIEEIFGRSTRRYFLDNDHLTEEGHRVVAEVLMSHLARAGIIAGGGHATLAEGG